MMKHNIELHIEELVLHGFAHKDRHAIGEAVQRELTRLFSEQGVHPEMGKSYEVARLDGGAFQVKEGSKTDAIGAQVARSVYGGLRK